jgi:hypothetical protein
MKALCKRKSTIALVVAFLSIVLFPSGYGDVHTVLNDTFVEVIEDIGDVSDGLHFYGESNASIYIVTVESAMPITIVEGRYIITMRQNGTLMRTAANFDGCYVTNGTIFFGIGGTGSGEAVQIGNLRYAHLNVGDFINYTYDDRHSYEYEDRHLISRSEFIQRNRSFPPGKWHFIFTGMAFDLKEDQVNHNTKVWFNFSRASGDIRVSTSEGGTLHTLYYPYYNANLILSKSYTFEFMVNGKADFHIENTFLFEFIHHPHRNGFWNIHWDTPGGKKDFNMIMINKKFYYDKSKVEGCVWGVGGSGDYELRTSYLDYDPNEKWAQTPDFIGLDVELP